MIARFSDPAQIGPERRFRRSLPPSSIGSFSNPIQHLYFEQGPSWWHQALLAEALQTRRLLWHSPARLIPFSISKEISLSEPPLQCLRRAFEPSHLKSTTVRDRSTDSSDLTCFLQVLKPISRAAFLFPRPSNKTFGRRSGLHGLLIPKPVIPRRKGGRQQICFRISSRQEWLSRHERFSRLLSTWKYLKKKSSSGARTWVVKFASAFFFGSTKIRKSLSLRVFKNIYLFQNGQTIRKKSLF